MGHLATSWVLQVEEVGSDDHFARVFSQISRNWCLMIDGTVRQSQFPCIGVSSDGLNTAKMILFPRFVSRESPTGEFVRE
jgi:hypothetical protein